MRKNTALLVSLIMITMSAVRSRATSTAAQQANAKDMIETAFPAHVGDSARYSMTLSTKTDATESKLTTDFTVEISQADESGFLIKWTYGKFHTDPPGQEVKPEEQKIVDLTRSVGLLIQLDPRGANLKLANWEEIQNRLAQGLKMLQERMETQSAGQQEIEKFTSFMNNFYQNRAYMTAYYTKEPMLFFAYLGKKIPATQPVEYNMTLPNPFGGDPFPARGRLSIKEYDPDDHRAVVLATTTLDPSQITKIVEKIVRDITAKMAPEQADAMPKDFFKVFSMDSKTEVTLDLVSGWPDALVYEASTTIEAALPASEPPLKVNRRESITMQRIKPETRTDPDASNPHADRSDRTGQRGGASSS